MKIFAAITIILASFSSVQAAEKPIAREWFYVALSPTYSTSDNAKGLGIRAGIPMQKGFYFVSQASYFPNKFGYNYEEFRYEFNVDLTVLTVKRFSVYGSAGLNFGYWKRKFTTIYLIPPSSYIQDRSLLFGAGMNYKFNRIQLFADYKWYPEIWSQHASVGVKFNFFANKTVKNAYFDFLKKGGKIKNIAN